MIDVSDAFSDFEETVQLIRKTVGSRNADGIWTDGTTSTDIIGVVQSLNSNELLVLPEGDRSKETAKIHTKTKLLTSNELTKTKADNIKYQDTTWNVSAVNNRATVGGYYKAILVRL